MGGPWECADSNGIHGFFFNTGTQFNRSDSQQSIAWQDVTISVYQRIKGKEEGGNFQARSPINFDGKHLTIRFGGLPNLSPFSLDLTFDMANKRWDGSWSLCDNSKAVLERPHGSASVNGFSGDWRVPDPRFWDDATVVHIRQSVDGKMIAWLDTTRPDYVSSHQAGVASITEKTIVLAVGWGGSYESRFEGTLSDDGKVLSGHWFHSGGISAGSPSPPPPPTTIYRRKN